MKTLTYTILVCMLSVGLGACAGGNGDENRDIQSGSNVGGTNTPSGNTSGDDTDPTNNQDDDGNQDDSNVSITGSDEDDDATEDDGAQDDTRSNDVLALGESLYLAQCAECHGDTGDGLPTGVSILDSVREGTSVNATITTMPLGNPSLCEADCAEAVTLWLAEVNGIELAATPISDGGAAGVNPPPPEDTTPQEDNAPTPDTDTGDVTPPPANDTTVRSGQDVLTQGENYYVSQCLECHGDTGDGLPVGISILDSVREGTAVASTITTMPLGNPGLCDEDCAESVVWWLAQVNNLDVTPPEAIAGDDFQGVGDLTRAEELRRSAEYIRILHKTSLNLVNRVPTLSEVEEVENAGRAGLTSVFNRYVQDEAFLDRVYEIYAPRFPVSLDNRNGFGQYLDQFGGSIGRFEEIEDAPTSLYVDINGKAGYANEAVHLIQHVVRNNRSFTEILTADYTVLNYFGAWAYGLEDSRDDWTVLENPEFATFPFDPEEYLEVKLPIPQAGIFSTASFLDTYRTSETNVARNRAYTVFLDYLDFDILEIPGSRITVDSIAHEIPTLTDSTCTGCHTVMDPVASAFAHWQAEDGVRYSADADSWNFDTILPVGFNNAERPDDATLSPLQWMADQVAGDRRFALSTVKFLIPAITGHKLQEGSVAGNGSAEAQVFANEAELINEFVDGFVASGYDFKALVVAIASSDFNADKTYLGGTVSLIPVERLDRKLQTLLDADWVNPANNNSKLSHGDYYGPIYQGNQPSGILTAVADLAAAEFSCRAVANDLAKANPVLLPNTVLTALPFDENGLPVEAVHDAIKADLQNLYWILWGQRLALTDEQLIEDYENFLLFYDNGRQDIAEGAVLINHEVPCRANGIASDPNYIVRSWMGVVNLLISDFRFIYE